MVNTWPRQIRRCVHVLAYLTSIKCSARNAVECDRRYIETLIRHTAKGPVSLSVDVGDHKFLSLKTTRAMLQYVSIRLSALLGILSVVIHMYVVDTNL